MKHIPVLLEETLAAMAVKPGGTYVDGTLGRAGHASEILRQAGAGATFVGIDRDATALEESAGVLREVAGDGASVELLHGRHGDIAALAAKAGVSGADGVMLDLGVSSPQLDDPGRGFSFMSDGPLDMRMDRGSGSTAADIVAQYGEEDLAGLFSRYGEEPNARRFARAIVRERTRRPFRTTRDLAGFIERISPRRGAHHPATRIFQALRMEVNDEMGELERALEGALAILKQGGRLAVITFESLTDRVVKRFLSAHAGREVSLIQGGSKWEGELPRVRILTKRAVKPSDGEIERNPRSRSAKLRAAERM